MEVCNIRWNSYNQKITTNIQKKLTKNMFIGTPTSQQDLQQQASLQEENDSFQYGINYLHQAWEVY